MSSCSAARVTTAALQIHDQGAGGNCNVVKEIIYPLGAEIDVRAVKLGDATMSVLEIWGAEYQENDCLLIRDADAELLRGICDRERTYMQARHSSPLLSARRVHCCSRRAACTALERFRRPPRVPLLLGDTRAGR